MKMKFYTLLCLLFYIDVVMCAMAPVKMDNSNSSRPAYKDLKLNSYMNASLTTIRPIQFQGKGKFSAQGYQNYAGHDGVKKWHDFLEYLQETEGFFGNESKDNESKADTLRQNKYNERKTTTHVSVADDEEIPAYLLCPITYSLFTDPVSTTDGHTYERSAILNWLQNNNTSPMTNDPLSSKNLIPNILIKQQANAWREKQRKKDKVDIIGDKSSVVQLKLSFEDDVKNCPDPIRYIERYTRNVQRYANTYEERPHWYQEVAKNYQTRYNRLPVNGRVNAVNVEQSCERLVENVPFLSDINNLNIRLHNMELRKNAIQYGTCNQLGQCENVGKFEWADQENNWLSYSHWEYKSNDDEWVLFDKRVSDLVDEAYWKGKSEIDNIHLKGLLEKQYVEIKFEKDIPGKTILDYDGFQENKFSKTRRRTF